MDDHSKPSYFGVLPWIICFIVDCQFFPASNPLVLDYQSAKAWSIYYAVFITKNLFWAIGQFKGCPPINTNFPPLSEENRWIISSLDYSDFYRRQQCILSTVCLSWYFMSSPQQTKIIVFHSADMGSSKIPPGWILTSKKYDGVLAKIGPVLPYHFPEIILTQILSFVKTSILSFVYSWQAGSINFFLLQRLTQSWKPRESSQKEAGTQE